jgi:peptidoglycan/LPS O-acetylase OafA/YrhL
MRVVSDQQQLKPAVPRLDGIDTLRGLSILAVILLHIWIRLVIVASVALGSTWPRTLSSLVWHNGGNGVTIFFAVSGFLIALTSLRRFHSLDQLRPAVFYRIRFARIMPLLLLLLLVLSVLHLAHVPAFRINPKHFTLSRALVSALTFHLNWLEAARNAYLPACWTVLWSLSIEEAFYFFFPLVSKLLPRLGRAGIPLWFGVALALVAMGPFARTVWSHTGLQQENSYLAGMSDIAVGCMAAWLTAWWAGWTLGRRRTLRQRTLWLMQGLGWLPIAVFATWPRWHWMQPALRFVAHSGTDDTLLALGASLICSAVALSAGPGRAWTRPLRWFGRHSYELYLSHEFAVIVGVALLAQRFASGASRSSSRILICAFVAAIVAVAAVLGWALAKWVSEPMNRKLRGARMAKPSREESLPLLEPTS